MKKLSLKKTNRLVLIPIIYICLVLLFISLIGYPAKYTLKNKYSITCDRDTIIRLFQFIPTSYGYQTVSNIKISPNKDYNITENNQLSVLRMECTLPKGTNDISIDYDVLLEKGNITWSDNTPSASQYMSYTDSELVDVVNDITEGTSTKDAIAIHKFVVNHMSWDKSEKINQEPKTALELYNEPKGVCNDFATLMTALLNSKGIPARKITGHSLPRLISLGKANPWSHQAGAHAWVEFYADDLWHISDPSWGKKYANYSDGLHLSYGDSLEFDRIYDSEMLWIQDSFEINAAMSQPLMFGIASSDSKLKIVPSGKVQIHYQKYLIYLLPLLAYIIVVTIVLLIRKHKVKPS